MDNNCVLVKKKEYDDLKKLADSKKPDTITVTIYGDYDRITGRPEGISSSMCLSDGIVGQINSIRKSIHKQYSDRFMVYDRLFLEYRTMGFFKRLFFGIDCILHKYEK